MCVSVCGDRFTLQNWFTQLMKAAGTQSTRWASRQEPARGASAVVQVWRLSAGWIPSCSGTHSSVDRPLTRWDPPTLWGLPQGLGGKEYACWYRRCGLDPWLGRCLGEGNGEPLQNYCLENPKDGGACGASVHGVAKESDTIKWLNNSNPHHGWQSVLFKVHKFKC